MDLVESQAHLFAELQAHGFVTLTAKPEDRRDLEHKEWNHFLFPLTWPIWKKNKKKNAHLAENLPVLEVVGIYDYDAIYWVYFAQVINEVSLSKVDSQFACNQWKRNNNTPTIESTAAQ